MCHTVARGNMFLLLCTVDMKTVIYYDSVPHTVVVQPAPVKTPKSSIIVCIIPQLKKVPNKCYFYLTYI